MPLPCLRPVLTQPPTRTVWPARPAPPSGREMMDRIRTRWENSDSSTVVVAGVMDREEISSTGGAEADDILGQDRETE